MGNDDPDQPAGVSRRAVLAGAGLLPLAGLLPGLLINARAAGPDAPYRFFTAHQVSVLDAATRRLVPGPQDDPAEAGHPGAHEANVVRYLDTMLGAFTFATPQLFAGGPWSNRNTTGPDHMLDFVPPNPAQSSAWHERISALRTQYADGVALLDAQAGGDFASAPAAQQDQMLASSALTDFTALLFGHTIEALYANPEYGGNAGLAGWHEIGWPGDVQPRGYTAAELAAPQPDPIDPVGVVADVLAAFPSYAGHLAARGVNRGW